MIWSGADLGREYGIFGGIRVCVRKIPLLLHLPEGLGRIWGDTGHRCSSLAWGSGFSLHPCCTLQKVLSTFLVSGCLGFVHSRGLLLPRPGARSLLLPVAVQVQPSPAEQCERSTSPPALRLLAWLRAPFPAFPSPLRGCCLVGYGSSDPQGNIGCPRVVNGAERHRAPCSKRL